MALNVKWYRPELATALPGTQQSKCAVAGSSKYSRDERSSAPCDGTSSAEKVCTFPLRMGNSRSEMSTLICWTVQLSDVGIKSARKNGESTKGCTRTSTSLPGILS